MKADELTQRTGGAGAALELYAAVAERFGTPTYLYDLTRVTEQARQLRAAFPEADVRYAVKANANLALLRHLAAEGFGAEALTFGELERCLRAGIPGEGILLGGPGHTPALAARALAAGVSLVSLDGSSAFAAWLEAGREGSLADVNFLVRLNPGFDPRTHEHLATAAGSSKFGVQHDEAVKLAEWVRSEANLAGFHVHAGSMLTDPHVAEMVVGALEPLYDRFPSLELVDLGGGFAVPNPPLEEFAATYQRFASRHGLKVVIEPGRYLVAGAGTLLTRVLHVKDGERRHVIADAGMADLLRPALYGAKHPIQLVGARPPADGRATDVDGPLCENADRLGRNVELPAVEPGDLLAVRDAGAYGFAMASNYVSSLRPAEVVWNGSSARLARRRETAEDTWRSEDEAAGVPALKF